MTKRKCPACSGCFILEAGTARCPHCGQVVTAGPVPRLSSIKAATQKGWTMLGRRSGKQEPQGGFTTHSIPPNPEVQERREGWREAVKIHIKQLQTLIAKAANPEEAAHWQQELVNFRR